MDRRQRKHRARRLEILRSAAAAFGRRGFGGVTMEEIGETLDMTKGNLYYYFESKQDLAFFCQEYSLNRLLKKAEAILERELSRPAQLFELIVSQLDCMLDELGGSAAHIEFRGLPEERLKEVIEKRDRYENVLRGVVKAGMREGTFLAGDYRMVVRAVLGAVNWTVQWYSPQGEQSVARIAEEFGRSLVRGVTCPEYWDLIPGASVPAERTKEMARHE